MIQTQNLRLPHISTILFNIRGILFLPPYYILRYLLFYISFTFVIFSSSNYFLEITNSSHFLEIRKHQQKIINNPGNKHSGRRVAVFLSHIFMFVDMSYSYILKGGDLKRFSSWVNYYSQINGWLGL